MLSSLRAKPHKEYLLEELQLRGISAGIAVKTPWSKLTKKMKAFEKYDQGWFEPMTDYFKDNRVAILTQGDV
jgi:hypothetical protein